MTRDERDEHGYERMDTSMIPLPDRKRAAVLAPATRGLALVPAFLVLAGLGPSLSLAEVKAPPMAVTASNIERRLDSVGTLLERSSAARQVELSGAPAALDKRDRAREVYRQAKLAHDAGNEAEASELLTQASRLMLEAVRAASTQSLGVAKAKTDYLNRAQSVKALLSAYQRVAKEKNVGGKADVTVREVEKLAAEAERLANAENYDQANSVIQRAYLTTKAALGNLRQGDTLVRSLKFETKEDEYHYELDRNDTHQMLLKVLVEEKRSNAGIDGMVRGYLEKAGRFRGDAEARAARGDFEGAVKSMEQSTQELVRAIRGAGIFIPG